MSLAMIGLDTAKMVCSQRTSSLMFVVNTFRHDGAVSARSAKLRAGWLLRSAGDRAAETTVSRL
jgi:hypothetical protein